MNENKRIMNSRSYSNSNNKNYNNSNTNETKNEQYNKSFKEFNASVVNESSPQNIRQFNQTFKINNFVGSNFKTDSKTDTKTDTKTDQNNELYFENMFNEFKDKMQLLSNDILNKVNCIEDSLNELENITTELQKHP